jgi:hypothetical protein
MPTPKHVPTPQSLAKVRASAILGTPLEDIALLLGITKGQLLRHYGKEIALAPVQADQAIAANLYNQARGNGRGAISAAKAWLDRKRAKVPKAPEGLITPAQFAVLIGVRRPSVFEAIQKGRVPIYDAAGQKVSPANAGRYKFVKFEEARAAWTASRERIRIVDHEAFAARRAAREAQQGELLRLRLARERGELIDRAAQIAVFENIGRTIMRAIQTLPGCAEELCGIARSEDVPGVRQWLRAKAAEFCNLAADLIAAEAGREPGTQAAN